MNRVISFLTIVAIVLTSVMAFAEGPRDVPDVAKHEIARRGSHVEMTGTIRSGLMAAALSPPAEDSAKWFLTLVVKPGQAESERMRQVLQSDPALKAWVDASDPAKSTMHYQVRSVDDQTQTDWLSGLQPAIKDWGLPLVVLQPPKNGQFGKQTNIVKLIRGAMSGEELSTRLRAGIVHYVQEIELKPDGTPKRVGIGVDPPFHVTPAQPTPAPNVPPVEWPPAPAPPVPAPNPSTPAVDPTTSQPLLARLPIVLAVIAGYLGRIGHTSLSTKIASISAALDRLSRVTNPPPSPRPNPNRPTNPDQIDLTQ